MHLFPILLPMFSECKDVNGICIAVGATGTIAGCTLGTCTVANNVYSLVPTADGGK